MHELTKINEKNFETSLIEQFLYPKLRPGQMWETVTKRVVEMGGEIHMDTRVTSLNIEGNDIVSVELSDGNVINGDYFISTMPVKDLVHGIHADVPKDVYDISQGLVYRDFITVGILLNKINLKNETENPTINDILQDTWIYIQESG